MAVPRGAGSPRPGPATGTGARLPLGSGRAAVLAILVSISALAALVLTERTGAAAEPAIRPAPPSVCREVAGSGASAEGRTCGYRVEEGVRQARRPDR